MNEKEFYLAQIRMLELMQSRDAEYVEHAKIIAAVLDMQQQMISLAAHLAVMEAGEERDRKYEQLFLIVAENEAKQRLARLYALHETAADFVEADLANLRRKAQGL